MSADVERGVIERIRRDPAWFARNILGVHLWSKQVEAVESVRDHPRTAIRSCHGPGKTFTEAVMLLWFLSAYANSRVISTAPTWTQVEQLLWREVAGLVDRALVPIGGTLGATKLEFAPDWFAIGLSTDRPERFAGHHAENILLLVDEASGVDEAIFEAGEGYLTSANSRIALAGNPTQVTGQFHRAFNSEAHAWNTITISVEDTPNFTGEDVPEAVARKLPSRSWAEDMAARYGRDSDVYRVRVLGEFPKQASSSAMGLGAVEAAQHRTLPAGEPRRLAVDVARFGDDRTVIALREGPRIRLVETLHHNDTMQVAGATLRWARKLGVTVVHIDDTGVGGGVTDRLRETAPDIDVQAFNGGQRAVAEDDYPNARSEAWFNLSDMLPDLDLDPDLELRADLVAPRYKLDSRGRRALEPKDQTKKRLKRSPDAGDAVVMLCAPVRKRPRVGIRSLA